MELSPRLCYSISVIELLIGFLAGSVATTYVGRKARHWKSKGLVPASARSSTLPPSVWSGRQCCAIILMSLPPEVSATLFRNLRPEEVTAITEEITRLPSVPPEVRERVLSDFCGSLGIADSRLQEASRDESALVAKALSGLFRQLKPVRV